jgi:hypothetical protein
VQRERDAEEACAAYNIQRYAALLENPDIDYVITSQRASRAFIPGDSNDDRVAAMIGDLRATWSELEDAGMDVIVVPDNAAPATNVPDCVAGNPQTLSECAFPFDHGYSISAAPTQLKALNGMEGIGLADVQDWICPGGLCPVAVGNVLIYRRGSHLTATFVESFAARLDAALMVAMSDE